MNNEVNDSPKPTHNYRDMVFSCFLSFFFYHMVDAVFTAPVSQRSWVQIPYGPEIFPGPIFNYSFQ